MSNFICLWVCVLGLMLTGVRVEAGVERPRGVPLTEPVPVTNGTIWGEGLELVSPAKTCRYLRQLSWQNCRRIDALFTGLNGRIQHLAVFRVHSDGWTPSLFWDDDQYPALHMKSLIPRYQEHARVMMARTGRPMEFFGFYGPPAYYPEHHALAHHSVWIIDGQQVAMVFINIFDRYGMTRFRLRPTPGPISYRDLDQLINDVLDLYRPNPGTTHDEWQIGDAFIHQNLLGYFSVYTGAGLERE